MLRRLIVVMAVTAALMILPGLAAAQAPAQTTEQAPAAPTAAPQASPAPQALQPQCQPGPGGTCMVPGKMSPEQMQQMQGKMGQGCCMMQPGQGSPMCQKMQKQIDELRQRVEALEVKKRAKK